MNFPGQRMYCYKLFSDRANRSVLKKFDQVILIDSFVNFQQFIFYTNSFRDFEEMPRKVHSSLLPQD